MGEREDSVSNGPGTGEDVSDAVGQPRSGVGGGDDSPGGARDDGQEGSRGTWESEGQGGSDALDAFKAWIGDLFGQASDVISRPAEFFAQMPREGGLWRATVFALVMGFVAGLLGFVLRVLPAFGSIFTTPLAAFASTVLGMFVVHVLAMLAGGRGTLDASYRLAAYLMVFLPLVVVASVLPYLNIAMAGYGVYALVMGVVSVHQLEERRAWSVFGGAGVLGLLVLLASTVRGG
jgi:hypothetical protein